MRRSSLQFTNTSTDRLLASDTSVSLGILGPGKTDAHVAEINDNTIDRPFRDVHRHGPQSPVTRGFELQCVEQLSADLTGPHTFVGMSISKSLAQTCT